MTFKQSLLHSTQMMILTLSAIALFGIFTVGPSLNHKESISRPLAEGTVAFQWDLMYSRGGECWRADAKNTQAVTHVIYKPKTSQEVRIGGIGKADKAVMQEMYGVDAGWVVYAFCHD